MESKQITDIDQQISSKLFGTLPNGVAIYSHELSNRNGLKLQVIDYGAAVTSLIIPLRHGDEVDVVLGFPNLQAYVDSFELESAPYLGATVGRYAGRIAGGAFVLNGNKIQLAQNNGENSLHGGNQGFSQAVWKLKEANSGADASITFGYFSPHGESFFPGNMEVTLTYTLTDANELHIAYEANADQETIINLTHHSYFNLDGHEGAVCDQELIVNANKILETNENAIPTGRFLDLEGHEFNFKQAKTCPRKIDTTFVSMQDGLPVAGLYSPKNQLKMTVLTDQPGVHIYVGGNCFNKLEGKNGANYHPLSGICFETQNFPDAPNHKHFPTAFLKKGETYKQVSVYKFEIL